MFVHVRPGVVASSEGYQVADLGIRVLTYTEADHVMHFDKDVNPVVILYYIREVPRWQPPFDCERISQERQAQIRRRVLEALDFMGFPYQADIDRSKSTG